MEEHQQASQSFQPTVAQIPSCPQLAAVCLPSTAAHQEEKPQQQELTRHTLPKAKQCLKT